MGTAPKDATDHTRAANAPVELRLDPADFERAERGLVAQHPTGIIEGDFGQAWNINKYDFIERGSTNPDTVHPSLWRQAQLNCIHGLFEVAPRLAGARLRHLQHHLHRRRHGLDHHRPADVADTTRAACSPPPTRHRKASALSRGDLHATATSTTSAACSGVSQADVDAGRCRIIAPSTSCARRWPRTSSPAVR
jgi:alkyl sulfatase BDS1-like metallo-beta-lactamase superfamily hydrolase